MKMQKRYIVLFLVIVLVGVLVWQLSSSFAFEQGYTGNNIVTGRNWGINITEIGEVKTEGEAILTNKVDSIATTLNFNVSLFKPGDSVSFDIKVTNTGKLNAELYAMTLTGISPIDAEVIDYEIMPLDYVVAHSDSVDGSIIKANESQMFRLTVTYSNRVGAEVNREYSLGLGSTLIYKQR